MLSTAGKIIISITKGVGQWRQIKSRVGKVPGFVPNCESLKERKLYNPTKVHKDEQLPYAQQPNCNPTKRLQESVKPTQVSRLTLSNSGWLAIKRTQTI